MATIIEQIRAEVSRLDEEYRKVRVNGTTQQAKEADLVVRVLQGLSNYFDTLPKKQQEINLEEFTEKIDDWKARFTRPDDIPVKATIAFTGRMFYMYPNVARQWYENLPKATQD